jgi:hypothetical protein
MREFVNLFAGSTLIGLTVISAAVVVVGAILWWNRKID